MAKIFKYKLEGVNNKVFMHKGAKIIHLDMQDNLPVIWAIVDSSEIEERYFHLIGTGSEFRPEKYNYIGTVPFNNYEEVYHIFEQLGKSEIRPSIDVIIHKLYNKISSLPFQEDEKRKELYALLNMLKEQII